MKRLFTLNEEKILDLEKYINSPSELIIQSVKDFVIYHQMVTRGSVELYFKFKDSDSFQGTGQDYAILNNLRKIMDHHKGKPWETLMKSTYLLDSFSSEIDFKDFNLLNTEQQLQTTKIISKGLYAQKIIDL